MPERQLSAHYDNTPDQRQMMNDDCTVVPPQFENEEGSILINICVFDLHSGDEFQKAVQFSPTNMSAKDHFIIRKAYQMASKQQGMPEEELLLLDLHGHAVPLSNAAQLLPSVHQHKTGIVFIAVRQKADVLIPSLMICSAPESAASTSSVDENVLTLTESLKKVSTEEATKILISEISHHGDICKKACHRLSNQRRAFQIFLDAVAREDRYSIEWFKELHRGIEGSSIILNTIEPEIERSIQRLDSLRHASLDCNANVIKLLNKIDTTVIRNFLLEAVNEHRALIWRMAKMKVAVETNSAEVADALTKARQLSENDSVEEMLRQVTRLASSADISCPATFNYSRVTSPTESSSVLEGKERLQQILLSVARSKSEALSGWSKQKQKLQMYIDYFLKLKQRISESNTLGASVKEAICQVLTAYKELRKVTYLPQSLAACIQEYTRQKEYEADFLSQLADMAAKLNRLHDNEVARRQRFADEHRSSPTVMMVMNALPTVSLIPGGMELSTLNSKDQATDNTNEATTPAVQPPELTP